MEQCQEKIKDYIESIRSELQEVSTYIYHDPEVAFGERKASSRLVIVADDDGVVVIDPDEAESLLKQLQDRFGSIPPIRRWVAEGKPLQDHPNANLLQKK
jgi:regulator of RNase E activity RraA